MFYKLFVKNKYKKMLTMIVNFMRIIYELLGITKINYSN